MNDSSNDALDPDQPRILKCQSTADFLAALPQLTGFTARHSIFVVFFAGKHAGQVLRVDLPETENPSDSIELLDFICDSLHDLGSVHGTVSAPAIVISSEQTFAEAGGPPWRRLARRLERRLRREGIRPRELCCIAPDGWISYLDPLAPTAGRPLSEVEESPIALEARMHGGSPPDLADLGAIPEPDPARRAAVAAALDELAPFDFPGSDPAPPYGSEPGEAAGRQEAGEAAASVPARSESSDLPCGLPPGLPAGGPQNLSPACSRSWMADTAEVATALTDANHPLDPEMTARLIRCAQHPDRWLLLAMGVLTRPEFPVELAHEMGPAQFIGVPVDLDADPASTRRAGLSIRRILLGICPDFTDQARVPEIRRRLLTALGETPDQLLPGLLAFSAWVWWLGGTQSVAHRQILEALSIDPGNELALMVERLISHPLYAPPSRDASRRAA